MEERWVKYNDCHGLSCPCCDEDIEVFTDLSDKEIADGLLQDGDAVRCLNKDCDLERAQITCDSETEPYISGDW